MTLHQAQSQIARCVNRFRVVCCGRRFGKTTLAIEEIKGKALAKENKIAYIAPTYQQARDIAWEMLKRELNPIIQQVNESRLEIVVSNIKGSTSTITLRGWESIETLRGQSLDFIVIDEVAMMRNFNINWQEVIRPTLTDRKGEVLFISTPKGFNHFYELYGMELKDQDYRSFRFTSYDNDFIPKEEIDKAKEEITEDRFAQEYLADFRKTEGIVYKEFDRQRCLFEDRESIRKVDYSIGIDFGFSNPAAVISVIKDYDDNYWVTREWYEKGKTDSEIAEYAAGLGANYYYPDPESASGIAELRKRGCNIRDVVKNRDSIRNGISAVRDLLKAGKLKIHKSCDNLIWEFETYSYPEKKDMRNEDENPIKENDHALDALRYVIMMAKSKSMDNKAQIYRPSNLNRSANYQPKTLY